MRIFRTCDWIEELLGLDSLGFGLHVDLVASVGCCKHLKELQQTSSSSQSKNAPVHVSAKMLRELLMFFSTWDCIDSLGFGLHVSLVASFGTGKQLKELQQTSSSSQSKNAPVHCSLPDEKAGTTNIIATNKADTNFIFLIR